MFHHREAAAKAGRSLGHTLPVHRSTLQECLGAIGHCRAIHAGWRRWFGPSTGHEFVFASGGNMGKSRVFQIFYSLKKNLGTSLQNIKQLAILNAYQCLPWLLNHRINTWKKHGELRELIL